jgi:hypothetical protein
MKKIVEKLEKNISVIVCTLDRITLREGWEVKTNKASQCSTLVKLSKKITIGISKYNF